MLTATQFHSPGYPSTCKVTSSPTGPGLGGSVLPLGAWEEGYRQQCYLLHLMQSQVSL